MKTGDAIELTVESIAAGGDGFARVRPDDDSEGRGLAVFLDRGLPGDRVAGTVVVAKKRHLRVAVDRIVAPGPNTVPSPCAVADACGGCRFWRAAYADELVWKATAAEQALRRIAREVDWPEPVTTPAVSERGYRGRARLRFAEDGALGFLRAGSVEAVPADDCLVLHPALVAARPTASALFSGLSGIESVFLEWDPVREGVAISGECGRRDAPDVFRAVRARLERLKPLHDVTTVVIANGFRNSAVLGDGCVHRRRGEGPFSAVVRDAARAFSQANVSMNPTLVQMVAERVGAAEAGHAAVELFAGSGNFTFALLGLGYDVEAVDVASPAVHAAADAWKRVQTDAGDAIAGRRARFHVDDLGRRPSRDLAGRIADADVVLTDPPRGGMDASLCKVLAGRGHARRLVYVSCDPPAMARDAGRLAAGGWTPTRLDFVDMFPRTPHLEAVAVFER